MLERPYDESAVALSRNQGTTVRVSTLLLAVAVLAGACRGQGTQAVTSPSPRLTPSAVAGGGPTCRLPISSSAAGGTAGFISIPGGAFTVDPTSNPTLPGYGDSSHVTGYTYDHHRSRWLPTSWRAVAGDGSAYAYWSTAMHVVDIDSGSDRSLGSPPAWGPKMMEPPSILALAPEGVYAQDANPGLWLIGPGGIQRQVTKDGYWDAVAGGAAWGRPSSSSPADGSVSSILRLDLKTGVSDQWFSRAGARSVVGVDAQLNPIVMATPKTGPGSSDLELWLVTGRDHGTRIFTAPSVVQGLLVEGLVGPAIGDSHGIWFQVFSSLYLYTEQHGVRRMADARASLAGGCG